MFVCNLLFRVDCSTSLEKGGVARCGPFPRFRGALVIRKRLTYTRLSCG